MMFFLIGVSLMAGVDLLYPGSAHASCNTREGFISNQPAPDGDPNSGENGGDTSGIETDISSYDQQTIKLDLAKDLTTLRGFSGRLTQNAPVLGLRMENLPGFDPKRHCNAVQPILYKPKIERNSDGSVTASVENHRFSITFQPVTEKRRWTQDKDPTGRFFWIFPASFNLIGLRNLTNDYDAAFRNQPEQSDQRRWIAEAYLDLAMRFYRLGALNSGYPLGPRLTRSDLRTAIIQAFGYDCQPNNSELGCLASELIEKNESAPPGDILNAADFTVGDALLENSGISTGIRQLDFGGNNEQALAIARELFPNTLGPISPGKGYRRPIRTWTIDELNRWYTNDGVRANRELSRQEAEQLLLSSHAQFLKSAVVQWQRKIDSVYPDQGSWDAASREVLALLAIDLQNVTGRALRLDPAAPDLCSVLTDKVIIAKRSNASIVTEEINRVRAGKEIAARFPIMTHVNWSCINKTDLSTESK